MRAEKQLLLDEIKDKIEESEAFVLMRYQGLTSLRIRDFRRRIVKSGGEFEVVRKRIFLKAAETVGIKISNDILQGHIGVVFTGKDPIVTTKEVYDFSRDNEGVIEVVAGHFDNALLKAEQVETLSKLPDRDTMRAQLLGLLIAPMTQMLATMNALLCSVPYCLDQKVKKDQQN